MSSTFRSVRGNRNAKLFFGGLAISNIGNWVQFTTIAIVVDRLTGKTTAIGILTALQFAPMLLLGAWAGAVSDRLDRRRMAIVTQSLLAVQAVTVAVLDFTDHLTLGAIYALTLLLGVVSAIDNPARRGFVTELVPEDQIGSAVSLNTATMTGSRIFGPALAAVMIGEVGLDTSWMFTANAASFVAIIASLVLLDSSTLHRTPRLAKGGTPVRDGLRFIRRDPVMLVTFVVFTVVATFGFNYNVALPRIATEVWGDEAWYGWVLTSISFGSLLGSLATAALTRVTLRWMAGMGLLLGAFGVVLAWAPTGWIAMGVAPVMGLGGAGFVAAMNAITQQECPPQHLRAPLTPAGLLQPG